MDRKYYVYEWVRLDTNEPFYVGKGKGLRAYDPIKSRSAHFRNIFKKVPTAVSILHDNLTEEEANQIECWYIHEYKYLGPFNLVNMTDGGEGVSGYRFTKEQKEARSGEKNWMYGKVGAMKGRTGKLNPRARSVVLYKDGKLHGEYETFNEAVISNGGHTNNCPVGKAIRRILNGDVLKRGRFVGFTGSYK